MVCFCVCVDLCSIVDRVVSKVVVVDLDVAVAKVVAVTYSVIVL